MLGLLAMLLAGSYVAATASAAGPFWYHKTGEIGNGVKISASEPERMKGKGFEYKLKSTIGKEPIEIVASETQVKGIIYNTALSGQGKFEILYREPKLTTPKLPGCSVTIGEQNAVHVFGHLMWKWNGTEKQRNEQPYREQLPDWVYLPSELQQGATKLPELTFTTITLEGSACGVLAGSYPLKGSAAASRTLMWLVAFSENETVKMWETNQKQHFFNGHEEIGAETGLTLEEAPVTLSGTINMVTAGTQQSAGQKIGILEN